MNTISSDLSKWDSNLLKHLWIIDVACLRKMTRSSKKLDRDTPEKK